MSVQEKRQIAKEQGLRGYTTASDEELNYMLEHKLSRAQARKKLAPPVQESRSETKSEPELEPEPKQEAPEPKQAEETSPAKRQRKPSTWNVWLANYRKEHNCSMKEAMAHKDEYHKYKESLKA